MQVGTTAEALAAASAAVLLWRGASRHEPSVKRAYRVLAAVAVLWGAAFIGPTAFGGPLTGTTFPLTLADLLALLALPALVIAVAAMTPPAPEPGSGRPAPGAQAPGTPARTVLTRGAVARLADCLLLVSALFAIGWLTLFEAEYAKAGVGAGAFTLNLIRPLADLLALGVLLAFAVRAGRRGLGPGLALLAVAAGDALAVGARISGTAVGAWPQVAWLAGLCLLGAAVWIAPAPPGQGTYPRPRPGRAAQPAPGVATVIAVGVAGVAALVTIGWAAAGRPGHRPGALVHRGRRRAGAGHPARRAASARRHRVRDLRAVRPPVPRSCRSDQRRRPDVRP